MRLTAVLAIACLVALAFAGCSGKDRDGDGSSSTTSSTSRSASSSSSSSTSARPTSSSSSSTGPAPANRAPTGSISVLVNGTEATFNLTGSDPDGDTLAWDLEFGDGNATNGTVLPKAVTHTYSFGNATNATVPATNLTAVFTVTDGKSPVSYNATLSFGGGAKATFTIAGATAGLDPTAGGFGPTPVAGCQLAGYEDPSPGGRLHDLPEPADGWLWTLTATYHVWFLDAALALLDDGTEGGTVPPGTATVAICTSDPANAQAGSYTFVASEL